MTEMSPLGTSNVKTLAMATMPLEERYKIQQKQGKPVFGVEMKIVDDEGKIQPHDGISYGRLLVRGPWIINKYYNNDDMSSFENGWLDTGDVATIDPDHYLGIVDRSKDVIKSGGEWISSIDLENEAVGHPDIVEACVIGVAHEKWDERPLLLVIRKPESSLSGDDIKAFLADKIAKWWMPDEVIFVDTLPHTATGKLLKINLRKEYQDYLLKR
jgi:fatty-acyl-CoA synthase